jgi:hypothetical protein
MELPCSRLEDTPSLHVAATQYFTQYGDHFQQQAGIRNSLQLRIDTHFGPSAHFRLEFIAISKVLEGNSTLPLISSKPA